MSSAEESQELIVKETLAVFIEVKTSYFYHQDFPFATGVGLRLSLELHSRLSPAPKFHLQMQLCSGVSFIWFLITPPALGIHPPLSPSNSSIPCLYSLIIIICYLEFLAIF